MSIPFEDWKASNMPSIGRAWLKPRRFKWTFKDFKKAMQGEKTKKLKLAIVSDMDQIGVYDMQWVHGGVYWPKADGGLIALPYDSKKFDFAEWI